MPVPCVLLIIHLYSLNVHFGHVFGSPQINCIASRCLWKLGPISTQNPKPPQVWLLMSITLVNLHITYFRMTYMFIIILWASTQHILIRGLILFGSMSQEIRTYATFRIERPTNWIDIRKFGNITLTSQTFIKIKWIYGFIYHMIIKITNYIA